MAGDGSQRLWFKWVAVNALGELLGLGVIVLAIAALRVRIPNAALEVLVVALGAIEGLVVGSAQWLALKAERPGFSAWSWISATVLGAAVAWFIGVLPSAIVHFVETAPTGQAAGESPLLLELPLAALLGAFAGLALAIFQWRVLKRRWRAADRWLTATALSWAVAMPLLFALAHTLTPGHGALPVQVGAGLLVAGAIVGAIQGAWLCGILRAGTLGEAARGSRAAQAELPALKRPVAR